MDIRRTIKVFLASSEELENDRNAFGNLIRRLDRIYERRGIRIELFAWEDFDSAYNNCRKQDEYNNRVRSSDIFLALFYKKAGKFTIEEFDVAMREYRKKASPKIYVYCRDIQPGELETQELMDFKYRLFKDMGHYWSRYDNCDTMQLHFVMQLQLLESADNVHMKVENGCVVLDGLTVACMDNLPFAADNEDYRKMKSDLNEFPQEIETFRSMVSAHPQEQKYKDQLQKKTNQFNTLKEKFANYQQALFVTALRIAKMQQDCLSIELQHAIRMFEKGCLEAANAILNRIEYEAKQHLEVLDYDRTLVHRDIEALQLKTKLVMATIGKPIEERFQQVIATYKMMDEWAQKSSLGYDKYSSFLYDYGVFLCTFGKYDEAHIVLLRGNGMIENNLGSEHPKVALFQNAIGRIYDEEGNYTSAIKCYQKALFIQEKILGINHPETAATYNSVGVTYKKLGVYDSALEYLYKAENIYNQMAESEDSNLADCYNTLGEIYNETKDYEIAIKYLQMALNIRENSIGIEHPKTAMSYYNLGMCYEGLGNYDQAEEKYNKALIIYMAIYYGNHPQIVACKNNLERLKSKIKYGGCLGYIVNKGCLGILFLLLAGILFLIRSCHNIFWISDIIK